MGLSACQTHLSGLSPFEGLEMNRILRWRARILRARILRQRGTQMSILRVRIPRQMMSACLCNTYTACIKTKTKFYQNIKYLSICISEKKKNAHVEKDELTILNTGHNWHQHVSRGIA